MQFVLGMHENPPKIFYYHNGQEHTVQDDVTDVVVTSTVTTLPDAVFGGCKVLVQVQLNEGLRRIGRSVFDGCTWLRSIIIP